MSIPSPSKHLPSLSIDELLQQPSQQQQQNWLLTYVDVFILIIMLVITLIALSDFKSEKEHQEAKTKTEKQVKIIPPALLKKIPSNKPVNELAAIIPEPVKPPQSPKEIVEKEASKQSIEKPNTLKQESQTTEPKPPKIFVKKESITPAQKDENDLQKKFINTISELGLIDSVSLKVTLGYAQLEIQDKILFKSSEATLVKAGESLLNKLTILLKQSTGLIYIEGHTDNRPIKTKKFPSNWELGASRATSVLHYLASQNLDANRLRAVSYGSTKPLADNKTKEGREKNRRVSLVIKISDKID